ncbi:MAG: peptide-methionine (S)-S-oxide reductase MsrA [Flavobacteriaceae bacterium]|jgi:peptide-methionine (S)-S-oxide reductase|nr:peptide-methionine (S)-S-oxide reductase MsrA [Flavobacteriaceae bacterium]MBT6169930.1 peptide-methionine (S)-S-oxide reductase MsrA [Flavobacteriaceae bacterium]MBT6448594.1 peptide-methionine (S)-S-oxide reductase MsrA [Flavobacteriaceae bacterium]MDG1831167.1 peptide-methionine (S)-S-oxide reductase MsrA [Flavobacteriaceae bacterium]
MIKNIILAGGCFWCTEAIFRRIKSVKTVVPGYIGGHTTNPTYKDICTGATGHAEAISIDYDSKIVSLENILMIFFSTHDPTTLNRQGNDIGTQYRSSIFNNDQNEIKIILNFISDLEKSNKFENRIVTTIEKKSTFYVAENYHHDYYSLNKNVPYCSVVIVPKVKKLMDSKSSLLK